MSIFSKIKGFLRGGNNEGNQAIDVNKPVTNPKLKKAFTDFARVKVEPNLQILVNELKFANFLMVILEDGLQITKTDEEGNGVFEKGSTIKFYQINNVNGNIFYPLFTDWNEIDLWFKTREGFAGLISPAMDTYKFVLKMNYATGLVINPASDNWTMGREQIEELIKDNPQ